MKLSDKISICIVEDNNNFREALCSAISLSSKYMLLGSFSNAENAKKVIPTLYPDIVIVDINLPGSSGINLVASLKNEFPKILFLMCTAFEDDDKIFKSLIAGANGYILKNDGLDALFIALSDLLNGGGPMSKTIAKKVINSFNIKSQQQSSNQILTNKEIIVLEFIAKGLLNKEVAKEMNISVFTVQKHLQNIYQKLHVNTRIEAVNMFLKR
jgi:DNA-binding NarL/FixJ family response regulator